MSKSGKTIVTLALVGAAAVGAWKLGAAVLGDDAEATKAKHAVNQVWIERMPTDARDQINHFVLIRHPEGRIGAVGKSSQWRHIIEVFMWGLEGERLSVFLPQDQRKAQLRVRTWECAGEAPKPFELCLELGNDKRSVTMYSRKDWVIDPKNVDESLADLVSDEPALAGVLESDDVLGNAPAEAASDDSIAEIAADWPEIDVLAR
jgi:hypothetical protein